MEAKLIVLRGADPIEIELFLPFLIGRSAEAALKIPHESVSREHCRIYEFDGELAVRDLGSRNGTIVNDQRIDRPTFLSPGDELTIGTVTFQADYRIRRQVVVTPHDDSSGSGIGAETTVQSPAERQSAVRRNEALARGNRTAPKNSGPKQQATQKHASHKASETAPVADLQVGDEPIAKLPGDAGPVVDIPVDLKLGDAPPPIVDEVELDTDDPVIVVEEDEIQDFLDGIG